MENDAVDCIAFWTKNPAPMLPYLKEIEEMGYKYYFQVSVKLTDGSSLTGLIPGEPELQGKDMENLSIFDCARSWLDAYFSGNPIPVDFPLCPAGTDFQRRVWALLPAIPYGQTLSYGAIARQLGENMSAQAVGQAVGRNPVAIVIPCHRVVGADGSLVGFGEGLYLKRRLLELERVLLP